MSRLLFLLLPLLALAAAPAARQEPTPAAPPAENPQPFQAWLADFMTEARSRGYSDALLKESVATLPDADLTAGLVDVGERKFLVYPNYDAILGYNCAHYYALTVALLGDSLR